MFDEVARHYDRTNGVLSMGASPLLRVATEEIAELHDHERGEERHERA